MSAKIKYTDESINDLKIIKDFLPSPDELAFREEEVKVTISLSKKSVEFFRSEAEKNNTQYQRMIRRLLDAYAEAHAPSSSQSGHKRTVNQERKTYTTQKARRSTSSSAK